MSEVVITVRNPMWSFRKAFGAPLQELREYVGAIIPNPKWVASDCICLSTGDPAFPFRVIEKESIVKSSTKIDYTKPKEDRNVFACRGTNGNTYTITREGSIWNCTCTGFGFRKDCKHVQAAKKMLTRQP